MAIQELYQQYHLQVYRFFLCLGGAEAVAEDLTQEVFLRALRGSAAGGHLGERAWLFRTARNLWIDRWRRRKRRPERADPPPEAMAVHPRQEVQLRLDDALHQLGDEERELFLMREVGGLSYDEIATACRTTRAAVRSRIYRARQSLRAALAESENLR